MKARVIGAMVALFFAGWLAGTAQADTLYWDGSDTITAGAQGGTGTWNANSAANWWDGTASTDVVWPNSGTDNDAVFGGTAGTVTTSAVIANDLAFNTTGYILSGPSALTLNGATPTITTDPGVSTTISSVITGSSGLTKAGPGTLTLSGPNTYTGVTTVNAGTLGAGSSAAFGQANVLDQFYAEVYTGTTYQGAMSLSESASIWVWRLSQTQYDVFINSPGKGQGYNYTGYQPDDNPNLYYYLLEDNAWRGGGDKDYWDVIYKIETDGINYTITVGSGYTGYHHNLTLGTGPGKVILIAEAQAHRGQSVEVKGVGAGSLAFEANSTGKVQLNGNNITVTGLNTTAPIVTPIVESGSVTPGTDILTVDTSPISDGAENNSDYAGVLQDGSIRKLALAKTGAGTLTLSGANTYTGDTIVAEGRLSLANAYLADGSSVIIASGAVLDLIHSDIDTIAALTVGGTQMHAGIYAGGSYSWLTGAGSLYVVPEPATLGLLALLALSLPKRGGSAILRRRRAR